MKATGKITEMKENPVKKNPVKFKLNGPPQRAITVSISHLDEMFRPKTVQRNFYHKSSVIY